MHKYLSNSKAKTLIEKIMSRALNRDVNAGEMYIFDIDYVYMHDGNAHLGLEKLDDAGLLHVKNPNKTMLFIDHISPSSRVELSNIHKYLRSFCKKYQVNLFEIGEGICHQIMMEKYASPGQIIVGMDSHSCMLGAIGCFSTGMGSTDACMAMALGSTWLIVPETVKVNVNGNFAEGIYSKDLILKIMKDLGTDGASYKAIEFAGQAIERLEMDGRMTLCNMAVEAGGKTGVVASDDITKEYLIEKGRGDDWFPISSDLNASYSKVLSLSLNELDPLVAAPSNVDNVLPVKDFQDVEVDQDTFFSYIKTHSDNGDFKFNEEKYFEEAVSESLITNDE